MQTNFGHQINSNCVGYPPIFSSLTHKLIFLMENGWLFYDDYKKSIVDENLPKEEFIFLSNSNNSKSFFKTNFLKNETLKKMWEQNL